MAETDEDLPRGGDGRWERDTLARLAAAGLVEQRRSRRWGILIKLLVLLYLFALLFAALNVSTLTGAAAPSAGTHTAVVRVEGMIAAESDASAERVNQGLRDAFAASGTRGVLVHINSPGGSPVQAGLIYDEMMRLREQYPDTPLYAVTTDLAASGGYYIAAAADRIFANRASLVGSIGVRFGGFGFVEAMDKVGVDRRLITAGENKALMDPFLPQDQEQVAHIQNTVNRIHEQFITAVKKGRGDRLGENPPDELFSGLIWTGQEAVDNGLVDDLASPSQVAREIVGAERTVDYTPRKDLFQRFSDRVGATIAQTLKSEALVPDLR
ncbi:S49 family peptidase [Halofilum ochraceum]|uniref:S49 family peptidase n=1 Tax=Halofilum ochraceum TaxID=1611323 RepID=UPI0008311EA0|nr:S49 family peptidase [Halofilum ochraceum]